MRFKFFRGLALTLILLSIPSFSVNSKVVVVPVSDDLVVIPMAAAEPELPPGTILFDALTDGTSSGDVRGGQFTDKGWKHRLGEEKIVWDLGQTMEAGTIEFELTGMTANTRGGYLGQPGSERAYYFGLFNDISGNKGRGGTNPAFIEIRYNWGASYAGVSAVKLQAGDFGLAGRHTEIFGRKAYKDWNPNQVYKHRVVFGGGNATLYIDGQYQTTVTYNNRRIGWRYLFLGDVNYVGISGPDNVTYRNVSVVKTR